MEHVQLPTSETFKSDPKGCQQGKRTEGDIKFRFRVSIHVNMVSIILFKHIAVSCNFVCLGW